MRSNQGGRERVISCYLLLLCSVSGIVEGTVGKQNKVVKDVGSTAAQLWLYKHQSEVRETTKREGDDTAGRRKERGRESTLIQVERSFKQHSVSFGLSSSVLSAFGK